MTQVQVRTGAWIKDGWDLTVKKENFWLFVLLALSYFVVQSIGGIIIYGSATAAVYAVILNLLKTGRLDFNRIEDGFQAFLPTFLAGLISNLLISIGMIFCLLPGLIISALYLFPLMLIIDRKMDFWEAMEESRKKVQENLWGFVVFILALVGIHLLGLLVCGIGVLVTTPVIWCATVIAYRELWPERQETTIIVAAPPAPEA
jgi:hypothetical protein